MTRGAIRLALESLKAEGVESTDDALKSIAKSHIDHAHSQKSFDLYDTLIAICREKRSE
jgi:hypothetical protein